MTNTFSLLSSSHTILMGCVIEEMNHLLHSISIYSDLIFSSASFLLLCSIEMGNLQTGVQKTICKSGRKMLLCIFLPLLIKNNLMYV